MYRFYSFKRMLFTVFCKIFVGLATLTKWEWAITVLDFFIRKYGETISKESVACLNNVKKWQNKAQKCIFAYHNFEKYMKTEEKSKK